MKTYKREVAIILLVWLAYVVEIKEPSLVEVLVWPVFTFAALSFGLDWFGKDGNKNISSMSGKKDTDRIRETPGDER